MAYIVNKISFVVRKLTCYLIICSSVSSCATLEKNPFLYDITNYPDREELGDDDASHRLSYMAREMMEEDDRKKLLAEIYDTDIVKEWTYTQTSIGVSMGADLSAGAIHTTLGENLGMTVEAIGFIWSEIKDGSMDVIGQAFLPAKFRGKKLDTAEKANLALSEFTRDRVIDIAKQYNWKYECLTLCDSSNQIFSLTRGGKEIAGSNYYYQPEIIIVKTVISPMVKVEDSDPISAFVGFPVKWKTPQGYTYLVQFFSEPHLDESNKVKILYSETNDIYYPSVKRLLTKTRIGRDVLKSFHSTPYTFYGDKGVYPKLFVREGRIYSFISNSDTRMIDLIVSEKPLVE